ncbi:uncharacterized protein LOC129767812 [Toxorhynchites rutilus septentrionalis]|uniref:uncharacterized protein LOC129767812 n=1 Tax=Toxorhynchites rutilus septentrionalis TaxID=329112 RepID=UPI002478B797|nr:uncharacterized protein LOC129767812 [Toxorhynchites rutilus septentrionalis]XP_055624996.1 uncharacterized protein LOC129767812 [Toxorhynchites rutilus septentrionalis]XP_055624997.1 uncharacterized protein LOC129767812 [Toxorhynchites rutilus septentrionalis]
MSSVSVTGEENILELPIPSSGNEVVLRSKKRSSKTKRKEHRKEHKAKSKSSRSEMREAKIEGIPATGTEVVLRSRKRSKEKKPERTHTPPPPALPAPAPTQQVRQFKPVVRQDPWRYRVGMFTFHTFRAMDPARGCICINPIIPCIGTCSRIEDMKMENYENAMYLKDMSDEEEQMMFGARRAMDVLLTRAYKYNWKYLRPLQDPTFDDESDDICRMIGNMGFN